MQNITQKMQFFLPPPPPLLEEYIPMSEATHVFHLLRPRVDELVLLLSDGQRQRSVSPHRRQLEIKWISWLDFAEWRQVSRKVNVIKSSGAVRLSV